MNGRAQFSSERRFALLVTLLYALVVSLGLTHHEMWRDEFQEWMIARDSAHPVELVANMRIGSSHPILWMALLWVLTRLTTAPEAMQALHLAIAAAAVFLFVRYAPFSRPQRVLFAFGYYMVFEYSVIARMYGLGILLLFAACVLAGQGARRLPWVGLCLCLASQTSVVALILAVACTAGLALSRWRAAPHPGRALWGGDRRAAAAFGLAALGALLAILQVLPPADWVHPLSRPAWRLGARQIADFVADVPRVFLPLPALTLSFRETNWLFPPPGSTAQLLLGALLLLWGIVRLAPRPAALSVFLATVAGLLALSTLTKALYLRHLGFLFLALPIAAWLSAASGEQISRAPPGERRRSAFARDPLLTALLAVQCIGGLSAVAMDVRHPHTQARNAARFIVEQGLDELFLVGDTDFVATAVLGYLDRDDIFYLRGMRQGSFVEFDRERSGPLSDQEVVERLRRVRAEQQRDVLAILDREPWKRAAKRAALRELAHFEGAAMGDERYHLYLAAWDSDDDGVPDERDERAQDPSLSGECSDLALLGRVVLALPRRTARAPARRRLAGLVRQAERSCRGGRGARLGHELAEIHRRVDGRGEPPDWVADGGERAALAERVAHLRALYASLARRARWARTGR